MAAKLEDNSDVQKDGLLMTVEDGDDRTKIDVEHPDTEVFILDIKSKARKPVNYSKEELQKKAKMRTASDVISRILWDPELPSENFVVGYVDRFVGLVEKGFLYFSWEDLASVDDHEVLAIPRHRIVYFKYRDTKVWDKSCRLDLVFGSTSESERAGEGRSSIHDYVKQLDEEFHRNQLAKENADDSASDSSSESSDINVHHQVAHQDQETFRQSLGCSERMASKPNYFVAIRVTDASVLHKVSEIKRRICEKEPRMTDLLLSNDVLHITLSMLRLDGPIDVSNASRAIEHCRLQLADEFFALDDLVRVGLRGLSTFRGGQVLYVNVHASDRFHALRRAVLQRLRDADVCLHDGFVDYVAHMTLLKLTRSRVRILQNPYIDPFLYVEDADCDLGIIACDNLKLCVIGDEKRSDGFYRCDAEVDFK